MIIAKKDKKPPRPYGFSSKEAIGNNSQRVSDFKTANRKMVWKPAAIGAGVGGGVGAVGGTVVGGPIGGLAGAGAGAAFGGLTGAAYGLDRRNSAAQSDAWDKSVAAGDVRQSRKGERVSEYHSGRIVPKAKWQKAHIKAISAENERLKQEAAEREANVTYIHKSAFGVDHRISKGEYDDAQEKVQSHRRKANRRNNAAAPLLAAGAFPLMMNATDVAVRGDTVPWLTQGPAVKTWRKAESKELEHTVSDNPKRAAAWRGVKRGAIYTAQHPRKATMLAGAPLLAAGGGLYAAKVGHNAYSNKVAREYNKKNRNSKIKIVPVTHKNRF